MSTMQSEVFEALRAIDNPEKRALKAAAALTGEEDVSALRSDTTVARADVASLKADVSGLKPEVASLKCDMAVLKWMIGTLYPLVLAILAKLLVH